VFLQIELPRLLLLLLFLQIKTLQKVEIQPLHIQLVPRLTHLLLQTPCIIRLHKRLLFTLQLITLVQRRKQKEQQRLFIVLQLRLTQAQILQQRLTLRLVPVDLQLLRLIHLEAQVNQEIQLLLIQLAQCLELQQLILLHTVQVEQLELVEQLRSIHLELLRTTRVKQLHLLQVEQLRSIQLMQLLITQVLTQYLIQHT
jgi:hypothetical protein